MEFSGERYYKINKILLNGLGLWPSRKARLPRVKPLLIDAMFFYYLFAQVPRKRFRSMRTTNDISFARDNVEGMARSIVIDGFIRLQLCKVITAGYDMNLLLRVLSNFLPTLIYTINYNTYYVKATNVSHFFMLILSSPRCT